MASDQATEVIRRRAGDQAYSSSSAQQQRTSSCLVLDSNCTAQCESRGIMCCVCLQGIDRRERLRRLALETIDLAKDPYYMRNHLGQV
jgi:hypothetical protein